MGLQRFERRLERLVEGAFSKAFRSGLQPVEIGRRIARELDAGDVVFMVCDDGWRYLSAGVHSRDADDVAGVDSTVWW
jgi:cysteine synthase B